MSGSTKQTNFGSRLGFILASAGSAVGLGAIWKFPYMAGTNGGAVFMLPYIFFTVTVGMALLLAEFAMGRAGRSGPVGSLNNVCGKPWGIFGGIGVFTVFLAGYSKRRAACCCGKVGNESHRAQRQDCATVVRLSARQILGVYKND